jgi:hypothetical protein
MSNGNERMSDENFSARIDNFAGHHRSNPCRSVDGLDRLVEAPLPFHLMFEAERGTIINTVRVTTEDDGALTFAASKTAPKASRANV